MKFEKQELDLENGLKREWIITNGLGGYASSTIIGANTRRYHGLFVAPLNPPAKRYLMLSKLDESMEIKGKKVKLQIWDTAGQERFKNITASYYRGGNGIVLIYDITDRESFQSLNCWLIEIEKNANKNVKIILIGNNCDLEDKREVSYQEGKDFA